MNILLVDVDSQKKVGNMAIRKCHTHFKSKGYNVEVNRLFYSGYPSKKHKPMTINGSQYDEIWLSIIFKLNKDMVKITNCEKVRFGGTGYDETIKLPQEIDDCLQDYSAYPDVKESMDFLTRGCIKDCEFCVVQQKEGWIHQYRQVKELLEYSEHKVLRLMDNNILAHPDHMKLLQELIDSQRPVYFDQGMDIQLINDDNARAISELNWGASEYIFAFDKLAYMDTINKKVKIVQKHIPGDWKLKFYIYTHPDMDIQNDVLKRVQWCEDNKHLPYVMRDETCYYDERSPFYTDLAAWCNQVAQFKKRTFQQFMEKRHPGNEGRIDLSIEIYEGNMQSEHDAYQSNLGVWT